MDLNINLVLLAVFIPTVAALSLWANDAEIAERHHSHHDTYVIAGTLMLSLVFAMVFMGVLGLMLAWLCAVGVFSTQPAVPLAFFDAFLVVSAAYWWVLRRYKVVTYEDRLEVTPFFGRRTVIAYADISSMEWAPSFLIRGNRNVRVYVGNRRKALLWSVLDLDQILIRINRFDVLADLPAHQ